MDNNNKNKSKGYVSLIDKELDYFRTNITKIKELQPTSYSNDILFDINSKLITNGKLDVFNNSVTDLLNNNKIIRNQNNVVTNKKPVVVINSFPKVEKPLPKKPVVIIKKNVSNLENKPKQTIVKKPVVSILSQDELNRLKHKQYDNYKSDYKHDLQIDFDAPPTQEQIDHSSVYIIPTRNRSQDNISFNKQVDNQMEKLNEKPFLLFTKEKLNPDNDTGHKKDFFHTKPVSSVFIKSSNNDYNYDYQEEQDSYINDYNDSNDELSFNNEVEVHEYNAFEETNQLEQEANPNLITDIQNADFDKSLELSNNLEVEDLSKNPLDNIHKSTKITLNIKDYDFESLILDSIEKQIQTSVFKTKILKKLNLSIYSNDVILIYSPSSSGKTTLLNIIAKKEDFNKGEYIINDFKHKELTESQMNDFINQHLFYIHRAISLSSQETVYWHLKNAYNRYSKECNYTFNLDEIIDKFNISGCVNRTFNILNNFEKTIVLIVYAIITNMQLILIDDPYLPDNFQDDYLFKNVVRTANTIYNKTIIMTTKDKRLFDVANKIYFLNKGVVKLINK